MYKGERTERYLLDYIDNLQKRFGQEYPNNQVFVAVFFQLRSLWVILLLKQSQEVCKCIYHEHNLVLGSQGSYSFLQILSPDFPPTFQGYFGQFSLTFKLI